MIDPELWVERPHPGPRAVRVPLTRKQREAVATAIRPATTEVRQARRGEALLLMAAGVGSGDVATVVGVHVRTVFRWKQRFKDTDNPVEKLADAPRSGRPPSLSRTPMPHASKRKQRSRHETSASR